MVYDNGVQSEEFKLDFVFRKNTDAVVIVPYIMHEDNPHIYLVSCFRPHREITDYNGFKETNAGNTWELPAGLVEPEEAEQLLVGYKKAACRELLEETGISSTEEDMILLGKRSFTGAQSERLFFFAVEVKNEIFMEITGDGFPLERYSQIYKLSLQDAIDHVNHGYITDCKTEIGLNRLQNYLKEKNNGKTK
jgi:8-oxo-dGTP pyrophosphatase MutT (NUDIX family)